MPGASIPARSSSAAEWQNLNGLWEYAITPKERPDFPGAQGQILVPFPLESALSGVKRPLDPDERLWYRRTFRVPRDLAGETPPAALWGGGLGSRGTGQRTDGRGHTAAGTCLSGSTSPRRCSPEKTNWSWRSPTRRMPPGRHAASRCWNPNRSGTRRSPAFGRPSGWNRSRRAFIAGLKITPDLDAGTVRVEIKAGGAADRLEGVHMCEVWSAGEQVARRSA